MVEESRDSATANPTEVPWAFLPKHASALRMVMLVAATGLVGCLVTIAVRVAASSQIVFPSQAPQGLIAWQWLIGAAFLLAVFGAIIRAASGRMFVDVLLTVLLFFGVWVWCWGVMPWEIGLLVASVLTLIQARMRRVIVHDLFLCLGCAGVAIEFGFLFPLKTLVLILVGLSVYDMVAARPHGAAQVLAGALMHRGAVPGLVIPDAVPSLGKDIRDVIRSPFASFLGAGDLILPMTLVAQAAVRGWGAAIIVIVGAMAGAYLLGQRKSLKPFPALLPLLGGSGFAFACVYAFLR
ncbi:MAG: hypothetical protein KIH65_001300 [Candidatus Uhrbacteria bacterium]|nr:hypothetical protein [Candidatus Uhrbacteria bacterium]